MPKMWEQIVSKVKKTGKPGSNPYAIATSALQKAGMMKKGTMELTAKGKKKESSHKKKK